MEKYGHTKTCDSCGQVIEFPSSWEIDNPPDRGWVVIAFISANKKIDLCEDCFDISGTPTRKSQIFLANHLGTRK